MRMVAPFPSGISCPDMSDTRTVFFAMKSLLVLRPASLQLSALTEGGSRQRSGPRLKGPSEEGSNSPAREHEYTTLPPPGGLASGTRDRLVGLEATAIR